VKYWLVAVLAASLFFIPTQNASAEAASVNDLFSLGTKAFPSFRSTGEAEAFKTLVHNVQEGQPVETDVIRAEWLIWLCTDPEARTKVTTKGIFILHARIEGNLNLNAAKVTFPVKMQGCTFRIEITLTQCQLESLSLADSQISSLKADHLTVNEDLSLKRVQMARGKIDLTYANIHGNLSFDEAHLISNTDERLVLDVSSGTIGGDLSLRSATIEGEVNLTDTTVHGSLDCYSAQLESLEADQSRITGDVPLDLVKIKPGRISFRAASIHGRFSCRGSKFIAEDKEWPALDLFSATIDSDVTLSSIDADDGVDLSHTIIGGALDCESARIAAGYTGISIDASDARVKGAVSLGRVCKSCLMDNVPSCG
jgi:hypothetical protein